MSPSWHLAIESSGLGGSVALFSYQSHHQGELHSQQILPGQQGSVRTLAPAIETILRDAQIVPTQLNSLSVTCGPGSFTGLRVGLTTAKMLAWTLNIPVIPVDTLEAIAYRFVQSTTSQAGSLPEKVRLVTAINAFRRQVFTSSWIASAVAPSTSVPRLICLQPSSVVDADLWLANPWQTGANNASHDDSQDELPLWISGGAIGTYSGLDSARFQLADADLWQPLAEHVGRLGLTGLAQGRAVNANELSPNYIRSSAAEENIVRRSS